MTEKGYNLQHARVEAQSHKMQELMERGICAFCEEHFVEYHDNPVEFETDHWIVSKNDYPYKRTSLHLLVIPKRHVRFLNELSAEARAEFIEVVSRIEKQWALESYVLAMRVGDPDLNGATVEHMHAHIVVGDVDDPDPEPVRFKMSSRKKA